MVSAGFISASKNTFSCRIYILSCLLSLDPLTALGFSRTGVTLAHGSATAKPREGTRGVRYAEKFQGMGVTG